MVTKYTKKSVTKYTKNAWCPAFKMSYCCLVCNQCSIAPFGYIAKRMEVRYATINDAEMIGTFAKQAFYDSYAWYNNEQDMAAYLNTNFTKAQITTDIEDLQTAFLLVLNNDELCGYAKLVWRNRPDVLNTNEKQLEIARFYAAKNLIGKGIGKQMMEAAIAFARQAAADIIWLDVWKENKRAIAFYAKWDFEIVSNWTFMLGKDVQEDYIMVKRFTR